MIAIGVAAFMPFLGAPLVSRYRAATAVAASTLLAAALFQPLRRRVQRAVDHRFDRGRYDAENTAKEFAERLRDRIDLRGLEADGAGTIAATLSPASSSIWIRGRIGARQ